MVYRKKVKATDKRFAGRDIIITGIGKEYGDVIPIPDNVVLCNGCNRNLYENGKLGYLIYLGKRELKADQPYDLYCEDCIKLYFPKAIEVDQQCQPV